jgi:hypothetical protein
VERWRINMVMGAGIGALLTASLYAYLAFGLGVLSMELRAVLGAALIGSVLGMVLGGVLSRPSFTIEKWMGVPTTTRTRIVMWVATVMGIAFAVRAGTSGELLGALGWSSLAAVWILFASGVAERARHLVYLCAGVLLLGLLLLSTAFLLGEF